MLACTVNINALKCFIDMIPVYEAHFIEAEPAQETKLGHFFLFYNHVDLHENFANFSHVPHKPEIT